MRALHLCLILTTVDSFVPSASRNAFVGQTQTSPERRTVLWDMEGDEIDVASRQKIEAMIQTASFPSNEMSVAEAESSHGMPWTSSIDPSLGEGALLYMPFWDWQMQFMKGSLTNLRAQPCVSEGVDFSYNENEEKKARIVNACFASDEYRKIRMSYYDAGAGTQVFNSVWYPNPKYNLPVLGIDLLAFNRKKYLAIVDFQPIHDKESQHAMKYEHILKPIKENYDSLKGRMSSKFYDETQFFSQQMLFARFEDEKVVERDLFPAFQSYVENHVALISQTDPDPTVMKSVLDRQQAYDTYSAVRDPATGLFAAVFGKDWADKFVYDFLFSLSQKSEEEALARPGR